jgi:hypothetical protein
VVAELLNTFLAVFNQIRMIPSYGNKRMILENVSQQLLEVLMVLKKIGCENEDHWPDSKRMEYEKLCLVFMDSFLPSYSF